MYRIVTISDRIRVPPERIGMDLKEAVLASIEEQFEGLFDPKIGLILCCVGIDEIGEGKIKPNDPGIFYQVKFKLLTFKPELHELVFGEVIDNTDFGSFVRIGPLDGLVHISQLMDDYVSFDSKSSTFYGKTTKKSLKIGDLVRARIISVSFSEQTKIGLTMRQAGLGSLVWIEKERRKK